MGVCLDASFHLAGLIGLPSGVTLDGTAAGLSASLPVDSARECEARKIIPPKKSTARIRTIIVPRLNATSSNVKFTFLTPYGVIDGQERTKFLYLGGSTRWSGKQVGPAFAGVHVTQTSRPRRILISHNKQKA